MCSVKSVTGFCIIYFSVQHEETANSAKNKIIIPRSIVACCVILPRLAAVFLGPELAVQK